MGLKVLLADDHEMFREGLCALLKKDSDLEVVGEATNGRQAVELAAKMRPDVVVMDIAMPLLNGIDATRAIMAANPKIRVIALTTHSDRRFLNEMLRAGATGFLLKNCAFKELYSAIGAVACGSSYISPQLSAQLIENLTRRTPTGSATKMDLLTLREVDVLKELVSGMANKEIAAKLHLSVRTVETHRQNIMDKLGLHNIAELTKFAIREGLTSS